MLMRIDAYSLAQRFVGISEIPGDEANPIIMAMLRLDQKWPSGDEVPWCSGLVNFVAHLLGLPRSHHLKALSWLRVGYPVSLDEAMPGWDIALLASSGDEADRIGRAEKLPEDNDMPSGHVGFYAAHRQGVDVGTPAQPNAILDGWVEILGGNQRNRVSVERYPIERLVAIRRLSFDA